MRKVQWGVLSTARIGTRQVIPAMQRGERSHVAAIASRGREKAEAAARTLGIARAYGSYEELLADPAIEAIYNPLPNHLHVPWTLAALAAGKHVLCEKPIALTAAEAEGLAAAAARSGTVVAEAFMVRHHPQWRLAKELVDGGRIGVPRAIQTVFSFFLDNPADIRNRTDTGGGGLYDVGCYAISTARLLFGGEPERVTGLFDIDPALGTDRMMSGLAAFAGGRTFGFVCGTQLVPCQRVQILGTTGRIEVELPFGVPSGAATRLVVDDGRDPAGGGREVVVLPPADQYTLQGDAFSRAVLGEEPLEWGLDDAVSNMRVIDAFFRAARSGAWERP